MHQPPPDPGISPTGTVDDTVIRLQAQLREEQAVSAALRTQVAELAKAADSDSELFASRAVAAMEEMATEQQRLKYLLHSEHEHLSSQTASLRLANEENAALQARLGNTTGPTSAMSPSPLM